MKLCHIKSEEKSEENFANLLQISADNFAAFKLLSLCLISSLLTLQELFRHIWKILKVGASPLPLPSH